jgi:predicted DNA-binding protein
MRRFPMYSKPFLALAPAATEGRFLTHDACTPMFDDELELEMEKNDGTIVIHLPKEKAEQFKRLCERKEKKPSEYGRLLIEKDIERYRHDYDFLKSIFE